MTEKHFYDKAQPLIQALAMKLVKRHGLSVQEAADSLFACGLTMMVATGGPERTAALLRSIADKAEAGRYSTTPPNRDEPLN
jgi:hypothetical protein